ncbi:MBL fold metallo-hydrolase [Spartinivicinus ruber]|uniref:MBL fold metallo-hydrolase n=1 Tax=Spartinivicinus ruber TaxID=2683272 RepID=UPI0013D7A7ED|nr:MBL fold metallo-hydrolase [Spartinivicinus ruber]
MRILSIIVLALSLAITTALAEQQLVADTEIEKIENGLYHFRDSGYSSLIVIGKDSVLVTDPGFNERAIRMRSEISKLTASPVRYVALTHEHYDHVGGTRIFGEAKVACASGCSDFFKMSALMDVPEVSLSFDDELRLDVGGVLVRMVHVAPGDGMGTAFIHVPTEGVIFSADMYMPREFTFAKFKEGTNYVGALLNLEAMAALKPRYAITAHAPGNTVKSLRENAKMYRKLHDLVLTEYQKVMDKKSGAVKPGIPLLFELPNVIRMDEYKDWKNYDKYFPAYVRRMAFSIFHGW